MTTNDVQPVANEDKGYIDYSEKSLSEIIEIFSGLLDAQDHQQLYKEAEALKAAFYKNIKKERAVLMSQQEQPSDGLDNLPYAQEESRFKSLYAKYKSERAEFNARNEQLKEDNYSKKLEIIEKIKALIEKGDVSHSFSEFRSLQQAWREIGPVPSARHKEIYETYQHNVEIFYDLVSIDRELRDLDFKKNLELKTGFCEKAEQLAESENVVEAFRELQKLHEEWKEHGPVAKEFRDAIWERFKQATSTINKKYQAFFEKMKAQYRENLEAKAALCEKVEEICKREIVSSAEWNKLSKEIEDLQKDWKAIGAVARKDSQKIYDRFRRACDEFFARKKEYYTDFKGQMQENLARKIELCEKAEALKDSEDWKATTNAFIELQNQWKAIGPVSRKKSEQLWKRFRAACDAFFENRDSHSSNPAVEYAANLKAKKALVNEINAYVPTGDTEQDTAAMNEFADRWDSIGFVPMKDKEKISAAYSKALAEKFPGISRRSRGRGGRRVPQLTEREKLVQKYLKKEAEIATYENNIGFFSQSSGELIERMKEQIASSKAELLKIEDQIKSLDSQDKAEE